MEIKINYMFNVIIFMYAISLADIVVTGEVSFYFVNFYEFNWLLEFCFGIRVGNVGFYDGTRGRFFLTKLGVPVGINASPDGK